MKTFFERKFRFEGAKDWINVFSGYLIASFVFFIMLVGFYANSSGTLYDAANVKEAKSTCDILAYVGNYIRDRESTLPTNSTEPVYYQVMNRMLTELTKTHPDYYRVLVYDGSTMVAHFMTGTEKVEDIPPFVEYYSMGQASFQKEITVLPESTRDYQLLLKAFRYSDLDRKYDVVRLTKEFRVPFPFLSKFLFLLLLYIVAGVIVFLTSKVLKDAKTQMFVNGGVLLFYAALSMVIVFNFSIADYGETSQRLSKYYSDNIQVAQKVLAETVQMQFNADDINKIMDEFNLDTYLAKDDNFQYQNNTIVEEKAFIDKKVGGNIGFIAAGAIFGLICGGLLIWAIGRNRGFERMLNAVYNFAVAYVFVLPGILGMFFLVFLPLIFTVILGFTMLPRFFRDLNLGRYFIGMENFARILGDFSIIRYNHDYEQFGKVINDYKNLDADGKSAWTLMKANQFWTADDFKIEMLGTTTMLSQAILEPLSDYYIFTLKHPTGAKLVGLYPKNDPKWKKMETVKAGETVRFEGCIASITEDTNNSAADPAVIAKIDMKASIGYNEMNFYYSLIFTILYTLVAVILETFLGILIAVILNEKGMQLKGMYQVMFLIPWIIPTYISGLLWNQFFQKNGILNQIIALFNGLATGPNSTTIPGIVDTVWTNDPLIGFFIVSFVSAWYAFPFIMLVSLAALQSVPGEVVEAASIDGANWFQTLFLIILPMIRPTVLPSVLLTSIWTFNNFNLVYLVTGGDNRLDILVTRIYDFIPEQAALQNNWHYGFASAYSTLIFLILLVYIFVFARATKITEKTF